MNARRVVTDASRIRADMAGRPFASGLVSGVVASLCCGGSLVFTSIGLGAAYSSLGLASYAPQLLAVGAVSVVVVNYVAYRRHTSKSAAASVSALRGAMVVSVAIGVLAMVVLFVGLEWLDHGVIHPHGDVLASDTLIPGVLNRRLGYAAATLAAIPCAWALPVARGTHGVGAAQRPARWVVCLAAGAVVVGIAGVRDSHATGTHTPGDQDSEDHGAASFHVTAAMTRSSGDLSS